MHDVLPQVMRDKHVLLNNIVLVSLSTLPDVLPTRPKRMYTFAQSCCHCHCPAPFNRQLDAESAPKQNSMYTSRPAGFPTFSLLARVRTRTLPTITRPREERRVPFQRIQRKGTRPSRRQSC